MPLSSARDRLGMRFALDSPFKLLEANNMRSFNMWYYIKLFLGAAMMTVVVVLFALTGYLFIENGDLLTRVMGYCMIVLAWLLMTLSFMIVHHTGTR